MATTLENLKAKYEDIKVANPKTRIRDLAKLMDTSEAQLVALGATETVTRLGGDFKELLKEIVSLGDVMALTRNDDCVIERKGVYNNVSFEGPVGLVLDQEIDLRLFMMHWKFGFAVNEEGRKSLQFFDKGGEAVHKIYLTQKSDEAAYFALVKKYEVTDLSNVLETEAYAPTEAELPDSEIDVEGFKAAWLGIQDTHEFFGMLRKFKVTRTQALRLAPEGHAVAVDSNTTRRMLNSASEKQVPIMIFVSSRGCIEIHSGEINKVMEAGPWYNIMDPRLNLHLREDKIANTWIVKKPSVDGIVTSIEVFDAKGDMIVQFFGKRKPGIPELLTWRVVVEEVQAADVAVVSGN